MEDRVFMSGGARRPEDIALDLMRYISEASQYGRTPVATGAAPGASAEEQHAEKLLQLYRRCVAAVQLGA
ncbi:MAG: hypothetical protein ACRD2H_03550 [Terriglobales bacterium]